MSEVLIKIFKKYYFIGLLNNKKWNKKAPQMIKNCVGVQLTIIHFKVIMFHYTIPSKEPWMQ